ncbi:MAG: Maf family protein [bacterium]
MKKIILASESPRRKKLLEQIGINFEVVSSQVNEDKIIDNDPLKNIQLLALKKAQEVANRGYVGIIIGADTQIFIDGEIIGKPKDREDAKRILLKLSGRNHSVITGIALIDTESQTSETWVETTTVKFRELMIDEIEEYLDTGEYIGKAGAYGIQERAAAFVERIEGCYFNVVGLPLAKLSVKLRMKQGLDKKI